MAKILERIISDRLYDLAESSGWFSSYQAGFRKGRGVEDQVLRVVQKISDGFQRKEKSLLVLLDFSKAYDTIWRQRLLHTLLNIGVPGGYVVWLSSFLQNRQARVRFNGELSKSRGMNQGLPQGSVLAPILFLFYINELAKLLPSDLVTAMYADDVSFLASSKSPRQAEASAQAAVDIVVDWSKEWKLVLNGSKSETSIFTLGKVWCPNIRINDRAIRSVSNPKLLGVTLDRTLTFGKHVGQIIARANQKQHILRAVSHSSWGWRKPDLRKIYLSLFGSILNYAGAAWQPWLRQIHINSLDRAQNRCLRLITTQALCAPVEALRAESEVGSVAVRISANILRSREKGLRLPKDHPRSLAFSESAPSRLSSKQGARLKAELLSSSLPSLSPLSQNPRTPFTFFSVRPWDRGLSRCTVSPSLPGITGRQDSIPNILSAALRRTRELNAQYNIYTDGSASAGTINGGAGVVITTGDPAAPDVVDTLYDRGAALTCSYEEERRAMQLAVDWINQHLVQSTSAAIYTDSQSLCMALLGSSPDLDTLRLSIDNCVALSHIQWVPGHCDIRGNVLADTAAKSATSLPTPPKAVTYASACAAIRGATRDPLPSHPRTRAVYAHYSRDREACVLSRADQSLLAKLRSGHYMGLRAHRARVDGVSDPTCNLCGQTNQTLEHWLGSCPGTAQQRFRLFGPDSGDLGCLTKHPLGCLSLARNTLFLGERPTST